MKNLYNYIYTAHHGDKENLILLIEKFKPSLEKNARSINNEDAYYDLELFFIKLILSNKLISIKNKTDAAIVAYIATAIKNQAIYLGKKHSKISQNESILESADSSIETLAKTSDDYSSILFTDIKQYLTNDEYLVIYHIFYSNLPIPKIALIINCSNWNIYKLKTSALKKLKNALK